MAREAKVRERRSRVTLLLLHTHSHTFTYAHTRTRTHPLFRLHFSVTVVPSALSLALLFSVCSGWMNIQRVILGIKLGHLLWVPKALVLVGDVQAKLVLEARKGSWIHAISK